MVGFSYRIKVVVPLNARYRWVSAVNTRRDGSFSKLVANERVNWKKETEQNKAKQKMNFVEETILTIFVTSLVR